MSKKTQNSGHQNVDISCAKIEQLQATVGHLARDTCSAEQNISIQT